MHQNRTKADAVGANSGHCALFEMKQATNWAACLLMDFIYYRSD
jgi:hypothetical protein